MLKEEVAQRDLTDYQSSAGIFSTESTLQEVYHPFDDILVRDSMVF